MTLRLPPALWQAFGAAAEANGTDRATLLREWIRAYVETATKPTRKSR